MPIILDPALLGTEGAGAHEASAALVKIGTVELGDNSIVSITGRGISREGVNNNFAIGRADLASFTDGVVYPKDIVMTIYAAMAEVIKGLISADGKWLKRRFNMSIQLNPPSGGFPGVVGLLTAPTLTTSIIGCLIIDTEQSIEAAGGAITEAWTIKPLRIITPSGSGY